MYIKIYSLSYFFLYVSGVNDKLYAEAFNVSVTTSNSALATIPYNSKTNYF